MPVSHQQQSLDKLRASWKRADWWLGVSPEEITSKTRAIQQTLEKTDRGSAGSPTTLLLTDGNKLDFLCAAIAGLESGCNLILGSEEWGESHFQQIAAWVASPVLRIDNRGIHPLTSLSSGKSTPEFPYSHPAPWIAIATGGSSGKFKLAVHTPETLNASALGFQEFLGGGSLNSFQTLPLYHISGWMTVWRTWVTGGKLATPPFSPSLAIKPSEWIAPLVPTQLYRELNTREPTLPYPQLRAILVGGAPLSPELASLARTRKWPLIPVYGMTETAALSCALPVHDFLNGLSGYGYPLPHAKLTIREPDREGYGPLRIHSRSLYLGYLGDPPRSTPWYEPSDIGGLDTHGSLQILGRSDSVIISGGKKISPEPIEQLLLQYPSLQDAAVTGIPDPEWGERLVAFVQWSSAQTTDHTTLASLLKTWLREKLPGWQVPKEVIAVPQLPRNELGKLQRNRLPSLYPN